jgi:DNA adenine methylase
VKRAGIVNVAAVPHRSPFRYPGGKTWLVPYTRKWLASLRDKPKELAEVFAGGAIVGLSALFDDQVERLTLVELDDDVAAVWR